jgi:hypothetical protein
MLTLPNLLPGQTAGVERLLLAITSGQYLPAKPPKGPSSRLSKMLFKAVEAEFPETLSTQE